MTLRKSDEWVENALMVMDDDEIMVKRYIKMRDAQWKARLIQLLKKDKNIKKTITSPNTKHPIILNQEDFDELLLEIK